MRIDRKKKIAIMIMLAMCVCGCEKSGNKQEESTKATNPAVTNTAPQHTEQTQTASKESGVDYDLTKMNRDMVYATVYQMMSEPETYEGKKVKMSGEYTASYIEDTKQYYHFVFIQDAAACCSQGMEFVWEDGSHVYPDEYPEEGTGITVTGVFETYREEGDDSLYCHLKDAIMEIDK